MNTRAKTFGMAVVAAGALVAGGVVAQHRPGDSGALRDRPSTPSGRPHSARVTGPIAPEVIRRTIAVIMSPLRRCFERALQRDPTLTGALALRWVIGASGAATRAEVASNTVHDPALNRCVVAVVRRMVFPAPTGGGPVTVTYPLNLAP